MPAADSVGLRESAGITTGICVWVPLLLLVFLKLIPQVLSIDGTELEEFVFRRLFRPVMLTIAWTIAMAPVVFVLVAALLYLANPSLVDRYSRLDELLSILGRSTVGVCTAAIILFGFRPIWHYLLYRLQAQDIHRLLRGEPMTEMEELLDRPTWPVVTLALTVTGLFTLLPAYFVIGLFSVLLCLTVVLAVIGEFTFQDMYGNWQFDETTSGDVLLGPWAARLGIAALVGMAVWPVEVLLLWFLKGRCQAAVEHVLVPITGQGASDALFRDTDFLSPWLLMATAAFALMTGQVVIWVFRKRLPSTDTPIVPVAVMLVLIMPWALFIIFWKLLLTLDLPAVAGHGGVVWLALHGGWFLALCLLELILWVALVRQHDLARPTASMIGTGLLGAADAGSACRRCPTGTAGRHKGAKATQISLSIDLNPRAFSGPQIVPERNYLWRFRPECDFASTVPHQSQSLAQVGQQVGRDRFTVPESDRRRRYPRPASWPCRLCKSGFGAGFRGLVSR